MILQNHAPRILVVGAGFAGAVHARVLAEAGLKVQVIDKRPHIGGNAYDYVDQNGIRVHAYGPHLFHSKNRKVFEWISRFGTFVPYTHRVRARLADGTDVPLPINLDTINAVFGTRFETEPDVRAYLASLVIPVAQPENAADYLYANIGRELTDLFFRPYTKKMWALDLEELDASVVKRIPIRFDHTDTYFADDEIQAMPSNGYTDIFHAILKHPFITVDLETPFEKSMLVSYDTCFNSMPLDEYFDFCFGELPYRSIRFHHKTVSGLPRQRWSVTNFTDSSRFTRETVWHVLPNHVDRNTGRHTRTCEEPCDYRDNNMERYYPVKTADNRFGVLYERYKALATDDPKLKFIGRCGTYQYLDMDQVINQALRSSHAFLAGINA